RDLEPDVGLVLQIGQGLLHRLEVAAADVPVEAVGEALQVDVGGIHEAVELPPRLGAYLPGRDRHGPDAHLATGLGDVDRVLQEDDRVVVGEGDAPAAQLPGGAGDDLRGGLV